MPVHQGFLSSCQQSIIQTKLKLPCIVYVATAADAVFTCYFSVSMLFPLQCQVICLELWLDSSKSTQPLLENSIFVLMYNQIQLNG